MNFDDEASALVAEACLLAAMRAITPPGIALACRAIRDGDETLLLAQEASSITARQPAARQASGAARTAARSLFGEYGMADTAIPRAPSGEPLWPPAFHGSLAHDDMMAVAALTADADIVSLGIDVEPAEPLPGDIAALVRLSADDTTGIAPTLAGRLLFAAKEAVYKASFPLDREILGYEHIAVDIPNGRGVTVLGRTARLHWCLAPRIVVLALI